MLKVMKVMMKSNATANFAIIFYFSAKDKATNLVVHINLTNMKLSIIHVLYCINHVSL